MMPVLPANHPQKFPSSVVGELRDYAHALELPLDWHKRLTSRRTEFGTGSDLEFFYEGLQLATYHLDALGEIDSKDEHRPIPTPPDPLVIATEHELSQPTDPRFRRFNDTIFRISEIASVSGIVKEQGVLKMKIILKNGKEFLCVNHSNHANSGMSTFEWFLEHVMQLRSKRKEP